VGGVAGRDVHAHVPQQLRVGPGPLDLDEDADGAVVVDVATDQAGQPLEAGRLHVLADDADDLVDAVGDRLCPVVPEGLGEQLRDAAGVLEGGLPGQVAGELDEQLVLGRRGALAAQLDEGAGLLVRGDVGTDPPLGRLALRLLVGGALVPLADDLDRLLHVAAGLDQGRLALHHGHVGAVAQRLDVCGGNAAHAAGSSSCAGRWAPPYSTTAGVCCGFGGFWLPAPLPWGGAGGRGL